MQLHKIKRRQAALSEDLVASDLHPLLKRIYANRNIQHLEQIDYKLERLLDYRSLKDIELAADIVADAVIKQKKIVVVGDFDADGATSTALMLRALHAFGLLSASYLVPNRFEYGYGLTPEIVEVALQYAPDLIVTVDNGISSLQGVEVANKNNVRVVITDHHLPGDTLPAADAIVNPNQPGCAFPSKSIAGVGVAFYLMLATRARLRDLDWFNAERKEPNMGSLLDLVALGTVADVVPLDDNNRVMVEHGLQRIRKGRGCAGIQALLAAANKNTVTCTSTDFGFFVGPRLNAAGRLDDMSAGIECLLTDNISVAQNYAAMLDKLNRERREIETGMVEQATQAVDKQLEVLEDKNLDVGLCLYNPEWHQGVVGLVASRIKERFHRPVIAFADAGDNEIKGSARSIPGLHIRDALDAIASRNPDLIQKFGGHAMAAGLSIDKVHFDAFCGAFVKQLETMLTAADLQKMIETDGAIDPNDMSLELAEQLRMSGPWGQHFPEPVFDDEFDVLNWNIVGEKHLKLQLKCNANGRVVNAIAFNKTDEALPAIQQTIRAAYRMSVNEFRGARDLQLIVEHIESA